MLNLKLGNFFISYARPHLVRQILTKPFKAFDGGNLTFARKCSLKCDHGHVCTSGWGIKERYAWLFNQFDELRYGGSVTVSPGGV